MKFFKVKATRYHLRGSLREHWHVVVYDVTLTLCGRDARGSFFEELVETTRTELERQENLCGTCRRSLNKRYPL